MKILITNYYNIRFLKPYQIPVATTHGDPPWYNDYKGKGHTFFDKRGVINGIREPLLSCPKENYENLDEQCSRNCPYMDKIPHCQFMDLYRKHLNEEVDFNKLIAKFNFICKHVKDKAKFKEDPQIILIVYEKSTVPCAERPVLVEWFANHGISVEEFESNV